MIDGETWERLRRESERDYTLGRLRRAAARKMGEVCGKCTKPFTEGEPRYRVSEYGAPFVVMCEACSPEWLTSRAGKPVRYIPAVDVYEWKCAGCGQPVVFGMSEWQGRLRVYCSERCKREYRRKRYRSERSQHEHTCEACGETFTAVRSDQRYCSGACRQRAYRQRKIKA